MGARQVAETDLKGRSTGRSGTSFVAADAQYGRGRPCDARGAWWGGATDASRRFSRRKTMGKIDARLTQWHSATNRALTRGNQPHTRSICVTKVPSVPFLNKCSAGRSRVYTSASTRDVRKLATAELDFASFILKIFSITLTGNYVICISEVDSFGTPYLQLCGSRVETAESGPVISDKTSRNNIASTIHGSCHEWYLQFITVVNEELRKFADQAAPAIETIIHPGLV